MKQAAKKIIVLLLGIFGLQINALPQPSVYRVDKLTFNSSTFNEIAPTIIKEGIIYCSDRKTSSFKEGTTFDNERLFNLYYATPKDSTKWNNPAPVKSPGSQFLYYGPVSIAPDGKTIYFTSSVIYGKAARKKNIKNPRGIFIGDLSGTEISNIRPFEYNNTEYSIAHPSISRDGRYLFFASDMPGGQGGSDLYYCENIDGKWSKPVNLGGKVNSPARENYPYMHPTGRLYFSSDRQADASFMGKLDVYYTNLIFGEWDTPQPMPSPINSKDDDFAFIAEDNLQRGYFSRRTGLNDDIWRFNSTIIRKLSCDTLRENNYCYEFVDENAVRYDTMPVPFRFTWNFGDGDTADGIKTMHCYKGPGNYLVRLDIINLLTNELEPNQKTYDLEISDAEQPYISAPDQCNMGEPVNMNADSTNLPGWNIVQYYWNFGDETVQIGKEINKTYIRPGVYNIQLIVTAAPDANGLVREACVSKNINVIRRP